MKGLVLKYFELFEVKQILFSMEAQLHEHKRIRYVAMSKFPSTPVC